MDVISHLEVLGLSALLGLMVLPFALIYFGVFLSQHAYHYRSTNRGFRAGVRAHFKEFRHELGWGFFGAFLLGFIPLYALAAARLSQPAFIVLIVFFSLVLLGISLWRMRIALHRFITASALVLAITPAATIGFALATSPTDPTGLAAVGALFMGVGVGFVSLLLLEIMAALLSD